MSGRLGSSCSICLRCGTLNRLCYIQTEGGETQSIRNQTCRSTPGPSSYLVSMRHTIHYRTVN
uniref:Uncharacterized protein n=1 Tax=Anguilla anguilla TaxID=7936 RepID=A0A0E9QGX9_ANGAN